MNDDPTQTRATGSVQVEFSVWSSSGLGAVPTQSLSLPAGTTVDGLLRQLTALLGSDVRGEVAGGGKRFLVINGAFCAMPQDLGKRLEDGDVVTLRPFLAGG